MSAAAGKLPHWTAAIPWIGGVGIGALALWMFMHKDKQMTKLEKTCLAMVAALCEKLEALDQENASLRKDYNKAADDARKANEHAANVAQSLADRIEEIEKLKADNESLRTKLAGAEELLRQRPAPRRRRT